MGEVRSEMVWMKFLFYAFFFWFFSELFAFLEFGEVCDSKQKNV